MGILKLSGWDVAQIWSDPRFDAVPEPKRKELFQEYRAVLSEVDAYNTANAAKQAVQERTAVAAQKVGGPCQTRPALRLAFVIKAEMSTNNRMRTAAGEVSKTQVLERHPANTMQRGEYPLYAPTGRGYRHAGHAAG